jgi:murein DD-endopeptidase MepM/ murein hydrolase activator NlpD
VSAGITDSLISDFAKAFSFDFDFQREINPGDRFEAVFQQAVNPAGERVGEPRLIYVSMTTPQKSRRFYRFTARGEKEPGWFDDNGRSTVRDLMRTPVDGARVTSKFGPRMHPIRGFVKQHNGTDFAAPTGTPVYAAGSGVVQVRDSRGAAGNMVRIAHDNGWATHYFHLSAFAPELTVGGRVSQGQVVGLVGTTGGSTGPHLHYEVIIEGVKVDPLTVPTGSGVLLSGPALEAFRKERDRIDLARSQQVG